MSYNHFLTRSVVKANPVFPAVIICDFNKNLHLNETFKVCKFNSNNCTPSDFLKITIFETKDNLIHECYKFNSGKNSNGNLIKTKVSSKKGINNGLKLVLYFPTSSSNNGEDTDEYEDYGNSNNDDVSDIGIHIGEQLEIPEMEDFVFLDRLSFQYNFIIKRIERTDLAKPYTTCQNGLDNINSFNSDLFRKTFNSSGQYSQHSCYNFCLEEKVSLKCKCLINECYRTKKECAYNLINEYDYSSECDINCPLQCQYNSYKTSLKTYRISKHFMNSSLMADLKLARASMQIVNVYFTDLSYQKITQLAVIDGVGLLSNIGGVFGLFIGASLLTFMEIFDFFLRIIYIFIGQEVYHTT